MKTFLTIMAAICIGMPVALAQVKISELPAASSAAATMQFPVNDSGTTKRLTAGQMLDLVEAGITNATVYVGLTLNGTSPLSLGNDTLKSDGFGGFVFTSGAGSSESLELNLTGVNTAAISSSTGVSLFDLETGGIGLAAAGLTLSGTISGTTGTKIVLNDQPNTFTDNQTFQGFTRVEGALSFNEGLGTNDTTVSWANTAPSVYVIEADGSEDVDITFADLQYSRHVKVVHIIADSASADFNVNFDSSYSPQDAASITFIRVRLGTRADIYFEYADNDITATELTVRYVLAPGVNVALNAQADDTYTASAPLIVGRNAGETITQWDMVYLNAADGEFHQTDADVAAGEFPAWGMAVAGSTDGNPITVLRSGYVRNDGWAWSAADVPLYLSGTPGGLTETAPSTTGDGIHVVAMTLSDDEIWLDVTFHFGLQD